MKDTWTEWWERKQDPVGIVELCEEDCKVLNSWNEELRSWIEVQYLMENWVYRKENQLPEIMKSWKGEDLYLNEKVNTVCD